MGVCRGDLEAGPPLRRRLVKEANHTMQMGNEEEEFSDRTNTENAYAFQRDDEESVQDSEVEEARVVQVYMQSLNAEELQRMEKAKRQILQATSSSDLVLRADTFIEEDWLGGVYEVPGNIYRIG